MHRSSIVFLLVLFETALSYPQLPQHRFNDIVIFGDSSTDTGNVYQLTSQSWPIVPPFYLGRFSNGPNWVDQLEGKKISNYAYGSATTDSNFVKGYTRLNTMAVPGVRQQVDMYFEETSNKHINFDRTLYIIWAGGNDFVFNNTVTPPLVVNSLMNSVQALINAGGKHFLVFNQPPFQAIPYVKTFNQEALFTALTVITNNLINNALAAKQQMNPQISIHLFDLNALIKKVLSNTSGVQFENTVNNCWTITSLTTVLQQCSDPNKYVFVDPFHFSQPVHELIADGVRPFLSKDFPVNSPDSYIHSF